MRPSLQKHVLAILRGKLGFTQGQMAELAEIKLPSLKSIEHGKLKLSEKLAQRIHDKTGVAVAWLLNNDVSSPPVDDLGNRFTRDTYDLVQSRRFLVKDAFGPEIAKLLPGWACEDIAAMTFQAFKEDRLGLLQYKLWRMLESLRDEFGENSEIKQEGKEGTEVKGGSMARHRGEVDVGKLISDLKEKIDQHEKARHPESPSRKKIKKEIEKQAKKDQAIHPQEEERSPSKKAGSKTTSQRRKGKRAGGNS